MPRQLRVDLADVAAWPNLEAALWAAARGKRARPDVAAFLAAAPAELGRVRAALLAGRLPVGGFRRFAIRDPKPRLIHAAPFADRGGAPCPDAPAGAAAGAGPGAHHVRLPAGAGRPRGAASRPGLCPPLAVVSKLDVEHYFPNLPHGPLLALLARRFKGSVLGLIVHVLASHEESPGRGLPIGSLTSQHFANQYLGEADRFALARLECRAHARYMDDMVLWCDSPADGRGLYRAVADFTAGELGLRLKPPCLMPAAAGLGFCGMRIFPGTMKLGARRRRSWADRRGYWETRWRRGEIGDGELQRATPACTR